MFQNDNLRIVEAVKQLFWIIEVPVSQQKKKKRKQVKLMKNKIWITEVFVGKMENLYNSNLWQQNLHNSNFDNSKNSNSNFQAGPCDYELVIHEW